MSDQFTHPYEEEEAKKIINDEERIVGCTVDGFYLSCVECNYSISPGGCVEYRNKFEAEVTMAVIL